MGFIFKTIINFIFPPTCAVCGEPFNAKKEAAICHHCISQIRYIESPMCSKCGKPFYAEVLKDHYCGECLTKKRYFNKARAMGYYDGVIRNAIRIFKYKLKHNLAVPLTRLMVDRMQSFFEGSSYDLIIPVPLHSKRLRQRGFNQALSIARLLSRGYGIPLDRYTLTRRRVTEPQVGLSERNRVKNISGAFSILEKNKVVDKDILLVDDVYTSGNTVDECSKVLIKAGAHKVDVLTLARVS